MEDSTRTTNQIASALLCRLSEAEPQVPEDPDAQHRHLLLMGIAQNADITMAPVRRRRVFRRTR